MAHRHFNSGFALFDTLIALLLFAVVLLAVIAALLRGMHATHDAVTTGRAVDLAADFLEARRALPDAAPLDPLLDTWNSRLASELPATARGTSLALVAPLLASSGVTLQ